MDCPTLLTGGCRFVFFLLLSSYYICFFFAVFCLFSFLSFPFFLFSILFFFFSLLFFSFSSVLFCLLCSSVLFFSFLLFLFVLSLLSVSFSSWLENPSTVCVVIPVSTIFINTCSSVILYIRDRLLGVACGVVRGRRFSDASIETYASAWMGLARCRLTLGFTFSFFSGGWRHKFLQRLHNICKAVFWLKVLFVWSHGWIDVYLFIFSVRFHSWIEVYFFIFSQHAWNTFHTLVTFFLGYSSTPEALKPVCLSVTKGLTMRVNVRTPTITTPNQVVFMIAKNRPCRQLQPITDINYLFLRCARVGSHLEDST